MASSLPGVTPSPIQVSSVKPPTLDLKLRVKQAFVNVVEGESLRNKWLTASGLENMIKHRYAFRDASNFTLTAMNKVISKLNGTIDTHDVTNVTGQFRLYKTIKLDGKYTKVCFYYITDLGHSFIEGLEARLNHGRGSIRESVWNWFERGRVVELVPDVHSTRECR
jgi:hypothetical protein